MTPSDASTAAASLRRLAQAVATLDDETPRVDVGDEALIETTEERLGCRLPDPLRAMYIDSDPVALTLPLPTEDIEFCPASELDDLASELDLPTDVVAFARQDETPIVVSVSDDDPAVKVGTASSEGWTWETVASSLADFLAAMAEIAEVFASSGGGDLASRFEVGADALIELEERLSDIDAEYVDRWMEWLD